MAFDNIEKELAGVESLLRSLAAFASEQSYDMTAKDQLKYVIRSRLKAIIANFTVADLANNEPVLLEMTIRIVNDLRTHNLHYKSSSSQFHLGEEYSYIRNGLVPAIIRQLFRTTEMDEKHHVEAIKHEWAVPVLRYESVEIVSQHFTPNQQLNLVYERGYMYLY
ncbi:MAG: hypothetical protein L6R42_004246 [Xanthoria sp. 1 TBL-2021]|nr:MAG: hypothetical protein L6R42_004246 [Xanthoria sp. 1 TBL-2021]